MTFLAHNHNKENGNQTYYMGIDVALLFSEEPANVDDQDDCA